MSLQHEFQGVETEKKDEAKSCRQQPWNSQIDYSKIRDIKLKQRLLVKRIKIKESTLNI